MNSPLGRVPQPLAWRAIALAMVLAATAAVASTARVFSATIDEPAHLAAGMQWLTTGEYTYDLQHPPLGRLAIAAVPYVRGARATGAGAIYDEGARLLGAGEQYVATLARARRGVLVFFVLLAAIVWAWGRRVATDTELGAAIATLMLVTNPNVLAHAGLATTDMACAATTVLALFMAVRWVERPSVWRATVFGIAAGLAVGSRLSAIAFVGGSLAVCYVTRGWAERRWSLAGNARASMSQLGAVVAAAFVVVLALYRFDLRPFVDGVRIFLTHGGTGHPTFLLGTPSNRGWWYYFPVALLVKTPLPLLLLSLVGGATVLRDLRARRDWMPAVPFVSALTIVAISLTVKVDLGVRLVLPVYPLLAIVSAQGALELLRQSRQVTARAVVGVLVAASVVIVVRAHPDHLAYFNLLAGDHPERVLVDSNLDWGQDLFRLRDTLRARGVRDSVRVAYFGTLDPAAAGVPNARVLGLHEHATGWIAASETYLAGEWVGSAYQWLLAYEPVARVGPGMRLWYIPPADTSPATRDSMPR